MGLTEIFIALVIGHFVGDYVLQSDVMAIHKSRHKPHPAVPWYHWLTTHAGVHGAIVWAITGIVWLAVAEIVLHWMIDLAKCEQKTTLNQDQIMHIGCKVGYLGVIAWL